MDSDLYWERRKEGKKNAFLILHHLPTSGDLLTLAITGVTCLTGQSLKLSRPHFQRAWSANAHLPAVLPVPRWVVSPQVGSPGTGMVPSPLSP